MMRKKIHDLDDRVWILIRYLRSVGKILSCVSIFCPASIIITTPQQFPELHCKMAASPVDDKAALEKVVTELATSNDAW